MCYMSGPRAAKLWDRSKIKYLHREQWDFQNNECRSCPISSIYIHESAVIIVVQYFILNADKSSLVKVYSKKLDIKVYIEI